MTEERRKFLAGISKEEDYIRHMIKLCKYEIKENKDFLDEGYACDDRVSRMNIAKYKAVIKNLKKQLPAPEKTVEHEHIYSYHCPICKAENMDKPCYCPECGQKLR